MVLALAARTPAEWSVEAYRATTANAMLHIGDYRVPEVSFETYRLEVGRGFHRSRWIGSLAAKYERDHVDGDVPLSRPIGASLPEKGLYTWALSLTVHDSSNVLAIEPRLRTATNNSRSADELQVEVLYTRHVSDQFMFGATYTTVFGRHLVVPVLVWQREGITARLPLEARWQVAIGQRAFSEVYVQQTGGVYRGHGEAKNYRLRGTDLGVGIGIRLGHVHAQFRSGVILLRQFDEELSSGEVVDRALDEAPYYGLRISWD